MKNLNTLQKKKWVQPKILHLDGKETEVGNVLAVTESFVFVPGSTGYTVS
jgi:hypothetical protein